MINGRRPSAETNWPLVAGLLAVVAVLPFIWGKEGDAPSEAVSAPAAAAAPAPKVQTPEEAQRKAEAAAQYRAELDAAALCRKLFRKAATHPSTVSFFQLFDEYHELKTVDGVVHFRGSAKAKNSYNLELSYVMDCRVKDGKIVEFDAREAK